jgi:hypothetical protein
MVAQPAPRPVRARLDISGRSVALVIIAAILLGNVLYAPGRFADYYAYLLLTDRLYYFPEGDLLSYEAGSNLVFLGLRWLTQSTVTAVNIAHYALGIGAGWGFWRLAGRDDVDWRGLVFAFGLFGAALAFVTIRATPAYFLMTFAALEANKGRRRAIAIALAALLFHVSAVLAIVPVIGAVLQNRVRALEWIGGSPRAIILIGGTLIVVFLALSTFASGLLSEAIAGIPFLGKYVAYTSALDPTLQATGAVPTRSVAHLIYLLLVSVFTLVMLLAPDENCRRMRAYILLSYTIFIFLQFSPVTAYRQSQFWVMPAAMVLPWRWFAPAGVRSILMIVVFSLIFLLNLNGIVS